MSEYYGGSPEAIRAKQAALFIPSYRPTTATDPFLSNNSSPLTQFYTPSLPAPITSPLAFSQNRKLNITSKRPSSMFISPSHDSVYGEELGRSDSSNRFSPSKRSSTIGIRLPDPAPFVGSTTGNWNSGSYIPPSPLGHQAGNGSYIFPTNSYNCPDIEMSNSFATPPAPIRILPSLSSLNLVTPDSIPRNSEKLKLLKPIVTSHPISFPLTPSNSNESSTSNGSASSYKSKTPALSAQHLQIAPLTPPLTPPCFSSQRDLPTIPSIQLVPSPATKPFPTLSAKLLSNYQLHPLFDQQYTILEELGSGGFGFVVSASRNSDNKTVAVKFIFRDKVPNHGWVNSRHWGNAPGLILREDGNRIVPMEAYVLRNVRHEGVVAYVDLFEDDAYFYLVMEHHGSPWQLPDKEKANGNSSNLLASSNTSPSDLPALAAAVAAQSLQQKPFISSDFTASPISSPTAFSPISPFPSSFSVMGVLSPPKPIPMARRSSCDLFECIEQHSRFEESTAKFVFAQIVEVVWALGKIGICHRDIKDENIVIDSSFRVKLIDFGSAVIFDPRRAPPFYNRFHGTTSFASAEILRGEPYQAPTSEIWSLGVLLSILITGECPFTDAAAAAIGKLTKPKIRLNLEVQDLLFRCLDLDVERRINIEEIRNHVWLRGALERR